jgi:predicted ATPase/DNA-binding winged helix-turn-helix (wHTH) protein
MGGRTPVESPAQVAIAFGSYRFLARKRLLLRGIDEVRLGSRALDILGILLERAGEIVPSAEIMSRVWPETRVERAALKVHIGLLRKALGERRGRREFIENVAGRGYKFAAPVQRLVDRSGNADEDGPHGATLRTNRVIGRQNALDEVASLLGNESLVTITGAAGIGKTTVACLIADRSKKTGLLTYFIDLAPLFAASVVSALASTLGLPARRHQQSEIATFLSSHYALLVLDNCEHVLTEISRVAVELLAKSPNIRILATSRERLDVRGEYVYRLGALDLPRPADSLSARMALSFSAIELFVDRASSVVNSFALSDTNVRTVVEICRRLDGNPLAIGFAAGQIAMFGLAEVARSLNSPETLTLTKRTSTRRHQTLGEALDWSYRLLSPSERATLRRLSIFPGWFDHSAAIAVCSQGELDGEAVAASLASLAKKSMIAVDDKSGRFRLLEITRLYANAKLEEAGEIPRVAELHAIYSCRLFAAEKNNWEERVPEAWVAEHGAFIDDIRSALAWAFSAEGNEELGVELAASSAPLWFQLSLLDEYIGWAERVLATFSEGRSSSKRHQLQLVAALGHALLHTKGPVVRMAEAFEKTLVLSNELGIADHRSRAYWGLCSQKIVSGDYAGALRRADEFFELYEQSETLASRLIIKRVKALALHNLGETPLARRLLEEVLAQPMKSARRAIDSAFYFDDRVAAMAFLGTTLWIEGLPTRAIRSAEASVEEALSIDHMPSLCYAPAISACPISFWIGDDEKAEEYTELLVARSREHHFEFWSLWGKSYATALAQRRGAVLDLRDASHLSVETGWAGPLRETIATICPSISDMRLYREAELQSAWCRPELLRIKGELLESSDIAAQQEAESAFLLSLKLARENGALSWEIKTAVSLANLWKTNKRRDARNVIEDVLGRFVDPYQTKDIRTARRLYEEVR